MKKKTKDIDPLLVPSDVPRSNYGKSRGRLLHGWFVVSTIVCPVVLVLSGLIVISTVSKIRESDPTSTTAALSVGQGEARIAVQDWLSRAGSNLVEPRIVAWVGQSTLPGVQAPAGAAVYEQTFAVSTKNRGVVNVSVRVVRDTTTGAVTSVPGAPYVEPAAKSNIQPANSTPWAGYSTTSSTPAIEGALKAWATAYTGGDPDALKVAVRDGRADRVYVPLSDASLSDVTVQSVAIPVGVTTNDAEQAIASVTLQVRFTDASAQVSSPAASSDVGPDTAGTPAATPTTTPASAPAAAPTTTPTTTPAATPASTPAATSKTTPTTTPTTTPSGTKNEAEDTIQISYDVLITDLHTGAPAVSAWGAPGHGPTLKPFANSTTTKAES